MHIYTITEFGYIINHFFTTSIDNEIEIPIMQDMVPIQLEHCLIIYLNLLFSYFLNQNALIFVVLFISR